MSDQPVTRWRYGARSSSGHWLFPKAMWEYELEHAKAAALRQFPWQHIVGVEPQPPEEGPRWIHERNKGWRLDDLPASADPGLRQQSLQRAALGDDADWWWKRERD